MADRSAEKSWACFVVLGHVSCFNGVVEMRTHMFWEIGSHLSTQPVTQSHVGPGQPK